MFRDLTPADVYGSDAYYVYVYLDQGVPFYVGKGTRYRWRQHLAWSHNPRVRHKLKKMKREGRTPIIRIYADLSPIEAEEQELQLIKEHGRAGIDEGGVLFNFLQESKQPDWKELKHPWIGRKHTAEALAKIRAATLGNKSRSGMRNKPESTEKNRLAHLGVKPSARAIAVTIAYNKARKWTQDVKDKIAGSLAKTYVVTRPDGTEIEVTNLSQFCKDNGLNQGNLAKTASTNPRFVSFKTHKGHKARLK